jgi:hypothetical protein
MVLAAFRGDHLGSSKTDWSPVLGGDRLETQAAAQQQNRIKIKLYGRRRESVVHRTKMPFPSPVLSECAA